MSTPDLRPLDADEERVWRALNRILIALPRALDEDLVRDAGVSLNTYAVLVHLSEAEDHELRMSDLAAGTTLSPSRVTRLVDEMQARGLVVKRPSSEDRRGVLTALTEEGAAQLRAAYPTHLASARRWLVDRLDPADTARLADALRGVVEALDERRA